MKVNTWLPVFSGFYGTIWDGESDAEMELENINELRREKGLHDIGDGNDDEIDWDYREYEDAVGRYVTAYVGDKLKALGFITSYNFQKISSPREYNYVNDSIHVQFGISTGNVKTIARYIANHKNAFADYIKGHYTSCSGFISAYSNNPSDWTDALGATLAHTHQLGAVLDFILRNEDPDFEAVIYEDANGNGVTLSAKNFDALVSVA